MKPAYTVKQGRRYRLKFRNGSDDIHPLHLHRHSFELVRVGGKVIAGVIKDVVLGGFQKLEFDFVRSRSTISGGGRCTQGGRLRGSKANRERRPCGKCCGPGHQAR